MSKQSMLQGQKRNIIYELCAFAAKNIHSFVSARAKRDACELAPPAFVNEHLQVLLGDS